MAGVPDPPIGLSSTPVSDEAHAATVPLGDTPPGRAAAPAVGSRVDRYEVLGLLGQGGMGTVYRVHDTELARDVALKLMNRGSRGLDHARALLRREAQAMARVEHPAVVRIYDVGVADERLYVTMELVDGGTLGGWLQAPRTWREILSTFIAAGRGLSAAHAAGLVHRDFKPANVLVDASGLPRVTDFGLARSFDDASTDLPAASDHHAADASLTATGGIVGTPAYMAPEQLGGEPVDARADQFAFCVSLWEALYGARPFRGREAGQARALEGLRAEIVANRVESPPAATSVPRAVETMLRRGLLADPLRRWPSVEDLITALESIASPPRSRRWIIGAIVLIGCAGLALLWSRSPRDRRAAGAAEVGATVSASLELGEPRLIDRDGNRKNASLALLRDGTIARTDGATISIRTTDHEGLVVLPSPDGRPIVDVQPIVDGAGLLVVTWTAPGVAAQLDCVWWLVPLRGGAPVQVEQSDSCAKGVDVSPGGDIATTEGNQLTIRDPKTGAVEWSRQFDQPIFRPSWSPSGRRIAVGIGGRLVVHDIGSEQEMARLQARHWAWIDDERLVYVRGDGAFYSELRIARLDRSDDELVKTFEASAGTVSVAAGGILVGFADLHARVFVIPAEPAVPLHLESLPRLDTGASEDFEAVAWTPTGELVTEGYLPTGRALIRTTPGRQGTVIVRSSAENFGKSTVSGNTLFWRTSTGDQCEIRVLDLERGEDAAWRTGDCAQAPAIRCAAASPRCIVVEPNPATGRWLDPRTLAVGAEAPDIRRNAAISPDGREIFEVDAAGKIVLRALDGDARTVVTPDPPLPGLVGPPLQSNWGRDAGSLLLIVNDSSRTYLIRLERTGQWRVLLDSTTDQLRHPLASPDGRSVAITGYNQTDTWSYLPIVADHGAR